MKRTILAMATFATVGCGVNNGPEDIYSVDSQVILNNSPSSVVLSEIAESVEIIKLETHAEALIGQLTAASLIDSLLLLYSAPPSPGSTSGGLFVFDSRTGGFKYKIAGFMDRGPLGYNRSPDPLVTYRNTILLNKWATYGLWDFTTGQLLDEDVPIGSGLSGVFFLNDTSVIVDRLSVDPGTPDKVEVISIPDGSIIRGLGQTRAIDQTLDGNQNRSRLFGYGDVASYYSMVCDTIYGINRETFEFFPRVVLNLGSKLFPDVKGGIFAEGYFYVTALCENDRYLFLTYHEESRDGSAYLVCYDKKENRTMYVDRVQRGNYSGGFDDDLSPLKVKFFPQATTDDGRAFCVVQAVEVVNGIGRERAAELGISEDDNPVIVVAHLKKE